MLLHVERQVQAALAPLHGGRLPAALPAYLHCLLVLLEVEGSPSMAKVGECAARAEGQHLRAAVIAFSL